MSEHLERDSLGEILVPDEAYYGAETQRARTNFPISGRRLPARLVHALGLIKAEAARVNAELRLLPREQAEAIAQAGDEVAEGRLNDHFVVDVFQTGSGTSSNMNANEVIAKRANELLTGQRRHLEPIHSHDQVNLGQSSNDVFPTAVHVAALLALKQELLPAMALLQQRCVEKAQEFQGVVKIGRTHLQDAVPIRLGQEFASYARMVERGGERVEEACAVLEEVALGATAVGTGLNTHPEFAVRVLAAISRRTDLDLRVAANYFEALSSRHALVVASGALKTFAIDLAKIAGDLRLLASGPRCGIGEITLPAVQPGSSMMPGKVNPVLPEAVCQVVAQVIGNDAAIMVGGHGGILELNTMTPMMADNLLESISLLANASTLFAELCVAGIEARKERCEQLVEDSLALATALAPHIGYDRAASLAQLAHAEGVSLRAIAARESGLAKEKLEHLLNPVRLSES